VGGNSDLPFAHEFEEREVAGEGADAARLLSKTIRADLGKPRVCSALSDGNPSTPKRPASDENRDTAASELTAPESAVTVILLLRSRREYMVGDLGGEPNTETIVTPDWSTTW